VIKVVLTGSESTGKTELGRQLAEHFDVPVSVEFVRDYARQRNDALRFEDHGPIARGQIAAEEAAIGRANDLVILDTDLISTVVYCEHYFGRAPEWIANEARARAGQLYLLLRPDIPWQPDGVRDRRDQREEMHQLFRNRLREFDLNYVEIGGEGEARLRAAVAAIQATIESLFSPPS
jgi:NadR type nicotinamide-nucleotide adenylyltransferase